jgi:hypothetical protein
MRKVTVSRPQRIQLPFSKGLVLVGGKELAQVKGGGTAAFDIPDGAQDIQVTFKAVPPVQSNILQISESDGNLSLEVKIIVPINGGDTTAELTKK